MYPGPSTAVDHPRLPGRTRFARKPLAVAVFGASLALQYALLEPLFNDAAQACAAAQVKQYQVEGGALGSVLSRFAGEAGVVLSFDAGLTAGKQSPGLNGTYSVEQGFARLLAGSELMALGNADGSFGLIPVSSGSALTLGPTSVTAGALGMTTEGTGSYTTGASNTATKLPLSLRQTPQSVSVVTRQLMDDQNLSSINDVLAFTPGVSSNHRDSDRYTFYARGFQIQNFQYDGIPGQIANESQQFTESLRDMAVYDRVEVLRGATGLLSGAGTPSATINLVRKRPTAQFQGYVSGQAGAWDKYRTEVDVSGPLTDAGNVRGRMVAAYQTQQSFRDGYQQEKRVLYGALDVDLSEDTLLRLSLDYQNNNSDGVTFGDMPLFYSNGQQARFSRSFNPAARWSYLDNTHYNFAAIVEHKLAYDWSLKAGYSHQYAYRHGTVGSASSGAPDPVTGSGTAMFINRLDSFQTQDGLDLYASGPFSLGGRQHELVLGANTAYTHLNNPAYERQNPLVPDIFQWDGRLVGKPHLAKTEESLTRLRQSGVYSAVRLKPFDPLSIILGTRVSWWNQQDRSRDELTGLSTGADDSTKKSGVVTPYAGVIYDLNSQYSLYASYTSIFLPQTYYKTASNTSLAPLEGDNYEIGLKGEFFDGALNASVALFDVEQKNTPEQIGVDAVSGREIYRPIAGTSTRGVETEISGELRQGWNLFGGYTYRESHDKDGQRVSANQPMNLFKLGTTYRLGGDWQRLTVGGNLIWQSEIYATRTFGDVTRKATQEDFAVVGLLANYQVDDHLSVGLNVNNLFDEKYYDGMGTFNSGSYGEPRNAMVNAKWTF
ncbi:TonB-dependent receptor [Pseudomonas chlororaphis]|jgi:outer membrane receptor for ferric coprogen and ferric-rhodotorulic acid|uniref:TonB-dependent receptor n=1 Tax=Pseudomonas morbosilactucae TaxID=2938197 RepID=A0ABT0JH94_9PSED|nr:TonB-dependent receptor [Pseudomonas morbosilactucae]MCK9815269.1 TonB-dependent receptor [Pseudomonas morbosilactucae]ROL65813.1 TonB-dependent receptor [Pseudomonas chlororaphis]WEK08389.1 MAG: TonB-dependent siderophore receptor [Pseudomonas sp.]